MSRSPHRGASLAHGAALVPRGVGIVAIGGITITAIAGSPFLLTPLLAEVSLVFLPATTVVDAFLIIAVMHMMIIDTHRRGFRASSLLWSAVVTSRTGRT